MDGRPPFEPEVTEHAPAAPATASGNVERWHRTTCPYCGVGCGVRVKPTPDGTSAEIEGDPDHPANYGRLCSKGAALGETLSLHDRLLQPMVGHKGADLTPASWDDALTRVADGFADAIAQHGPESVAFYVSGQILTEDYYVANKLMKGFIGTANIDTNSRLCMASSVAGHTRAFGADTVPGCYEDLERADMVVLVGSNLAWCHPVLFQRLAAARAERGTRVVVIDPRRTATCDSADQHLALRPGSDVALFNGLFAHLAASPALDPLFVAQHTVGFDDAVDAAGTMTLADIAATTGLAPDAIRDFYEAFTRTAHVVTVYSQGVNQSSAGTDKVNAILNCHLATGRIGLPGCGPFSVTGQPNAMGGRETGGLATMLAAHMNLANADDRARVQRFWRAPRMAERPGLKAVDLFEAVHAGRIKAVWVMATNPVDSLPDADRVRDALRACPLVVVSDVARHTDTTAVADVLLPAQAWGEKDGTVTNSERRISRQKRFLPLPGDVRADWWQLCEVAKRLGFADAFTYDGPAAIFREYAALTAIDNAGTRDLDLSGLAHISDAAYDGFTPLQWPYRTDDAHEAETEVARTGADATTPLATSDRLANATTPLTPRAPHSAKRFFANGQFFTPDRKARLVPTPYRAPASQPDDTYPLILNTGRIRDQWHTMTRTAKTQRLTSHISEPFIEIHPRDAEACAIAAADLVEVRGKHGRLRARAVLTDRGAPGQVFASMHWTEQFANAGRIDTVLRANVDPVSGQPELKYTPVAIAPLAVAWHAFAVTAQRPTLADYAYAAIAPIQGDAWRCELAGTRAPEDWAALASALLFGPHDSDVDMLAYYDAGAQQHRFAAFDGERCIGLLYSAPSPVPVSRTWAVNAFGQTIARGERLRLLAGRPGADVPDRGRIACACMDVGKNDIIAAIAQAGCDTLDDVGRATGAGTNCGSCRAEIGMLLNAGAHAKTV
ncbi:MAG: nitrate reductase [Pseudomonadota bacterium]